MPTSDKLSMKKLFLMLSLMPTLLLAQSSEFKTREIAVMAGLSHERDCQSGKRARPLEVEIDELEDRAIGLFAGVTTLGDVATVRKDKKEGKTYASISVCGPDGWSVSNVIIFPNMKTDANGNCQVDQITSMDLVVTMKDQHGVTTDFTKAFRPIDFEESDLCAKKRGLEINDADPTIPLPAKDKESEYGMDELKVEQN